jgi:hypothetical protein
VTNNSATFTGQVGKTYSFYSIATDNVGHVETTPLAADASTTLKATSTPSPTTQPTTTPTPTTKSTPTPITDPTTSPSPSPTINPTKNPTPKPTVTPTSLDIGYVALLLLVLAGIAFASLVLVKKVKLRK